MNDLPEPFNYSVDALSMMVVLGSILNVLPALSALFAIVWTSIRIYETKTIQDLIKRWRGE